MVDNLFRSKNEMRYRTISDQEPCVMCAYYLDPYECEFVEAPISPYGTCVLWFPFEGTALLACGCVAN